MQTFRPMKWLIMIIIVSLLATACSSQNAEQPAPPNDATENGNGVDNGNETADGTDNLIPAEVDEIYTARCIHCHGPDLQGRMGDNSNLLQVGARLTQEEIAETIRNGRDLMPAFSGQLSEEEITMLAEWLAAKK